MTEASEARRMTVVYESRSVKACLERALVLQALDIPYQLFELDFRHAVAVDSERAEDARDQIALYERENRGWPPQLIEMPRMASGVAGVMIYITILVALHIMDTGAAYGFDWKLAGRIDGRLMLNGEWLRSVTALTLHGDFPHLIGNVFFGSIFGLFTGQLLGQGLAWSLILSAGALGNITNVLVQHPSHRAVGASTAVFAALGLLTAYTWMHRQDKRYRMAYRSAPLISGAVLLAYLGTGDARTDIVAHLTGFAWGLIAGVAATYIPRHWQQSARNQLALGIAAIATIALAWSVQLTITIG